MWSKLRRNLRTHVHDEHSWRCYPSRPKSTTRAFDRGGVFVIAVAHQLSLQHSQLEQQPEGWRFVPDTILPGNRRAPQWVPARTPTAHWEWPEQQFSTANSADTSQTLILKKKFFSFFFRFFSFFFFCVFHVFSFHLLGSPAPPPPLPSPLP